MGLALPEHWIWDFWFADDGERHHVFFLQAPKSIGDPQQRHWHASIGHAVSTDLQHWQLQPTALEAAPSPAFDDGATWTGCVVRHANGWWMFYTGISRAENLRRQRIGLASSTDLIHWHRHGLVLDALPPPYEAEHDPGRWYDRSLRDPHVFWDATAGRWRMLFSARLSAGPSDAAGVVGMAVSEDLLRWQVQPPLVAPGMAAELEVPQWFEMHGVEHILFCTAGDRYARSFRAAHPEWPCWTGTHHFIKPHNGGGAWQVAPPPLLSADANGSGYAGKVVTARDGQRMFLRFLLNDERGQFVGALDDPVVLVGRGQGGLALVNNIKG
jgi:beta-fructofuranosidase